MRILLRIPHPRVPVANSLHVGRDDDGRLEVQSEIWFRQGDDAQVDPTPDMEWSEPIRELVRRIVGGDVLYRVMLDLLWQERLSDPEVAQTVEVLTDLAPEMIADFRAAHADVVAGREIGFDPDRAPERERREDSAGWLLMQWLEAAEAAEGARDGEGRATGEDG